MPGAYAGATYAILPTSTTNATHWQLDVLCNGCSKWEGGALDPNGVNNLAWAKSATAVVTPGSNTSSFGYHDGRGVFAHDLSAAKIPKGVFDAVVYGLNNPSTPTTSRTTKSAGNTSPTRLTELPPASSSSKPPTVVTTRVTELPKPSTTTVAATSQKPPVVVTTRITTRITQLPPTTTTTRGPVITWIPDPGFSTTKTIGGPGIVTLTVTARPPATTTQAVGELPPWIGGGPPWGRGKGGGWGKRGGRWERRERLAVRPEE